MSLSMLVLLFRLCAAFFELCVCITASLVFVLMIRRSRQGRTPQVPVTVIVVGGIGCLVCLGAMILLIVRMLFVF